MTADGLATGLMVLAISKMEVANQNNIPVLMIVKRMTVLKSWFQSLPTICEK